MNYNVTIRIGNTNVKQLKIEANSENEAVANAKAENAGLNSLFESAKYTAVLIS